MDMSSDYGGILRRYVPNIVVARYLENPKPLCHPEMQSFLGAVGFFDISGYSLLASELKMQEHDAGQSSQLGSATEVLTSKLNATLEPVIDTISKYRGDIVKVRDSLRDRSPTYFSS